MTSPAPETGRTAEEMREFVLIKRGLYWRPNAMGYTGVLAEAGLYTEADARARADGDGTTMHLASEATEFAPACWQETKIAVLSQQVAHLRAENANLRDRVREAEGAAEALPDMLRKCRFQSAVIDSLSEKIGNARRMTNGWAKGTLLLLPFVDMAAGEGLEWAEQDDGSPRMDAADLCAAFAKAMGLEIGDAAYMAMIAEGRDAIRALSPEPQEAGDGSL